MYKLKFAPNLGPSLINVARDNITAWEPELRVLLPNLLQIVNVEISESPTSGEYVSSEGAWSFGVNGSTLTHNTVHIEIDTKTGIELPKLMDVLKGTVFHELFHVARGYSLESPGLTLMDVAIEEGLATKFEIIKAGTNPWYGHYGIKETMLATLDEVRNADQQENKDWQRWKYYDPNTDRHWILYRVGTFIADEVLAKNPGIDIQGLAKLTRQEILDLSRL